MTRVRSALSEILPRLALFVPVPLAFGVLRFLSATPEDYASSSASISSVYLTFVSANQATFLYVPVFSFYAARQIQMQLCAYRMSRRSSWLQAYCGLMVTLCLGSGLFSLAILIPSLAALAFKSGLTFSADALMGFAVVQFLYETLFFIVVSSLCIVSFLISRSAILALLACVIYGGSDSFVAAFGAYHGEFWSGWMLMGYADPAQPLLATAGALRLLAFIAILVIAGIRLVQSVDVFESAFHE